MNSTRNKASATTGLRKIDSVEVVVALGGNLEEPVEAFVRTLQRMSEHHELSGMTELYSSAGIGGPEQADYINAAVALRLNCPLDESVMLWLLSLEKLEGRKRELKWGPRTLDLDILWAGNGLVVDSARLLVPHPRLCERAFALMPLLDLYPEAMDPKTGRPLYESLESTKDQSIHKFRSEKWEELATSRGICIRTDNQTS